MFGPKRLGLTGTPLRAGLVFRLVLGWASAAGSSTSRSPIFSASCYRVRRSLRYSRSMANAFNNGKSEESSGLCADCFHSRSVESSRGSVFLLCELSRSDPRFTKYPRLPVLSCPGYQRIREQVDGPKNCLFFFFSPL